MLFGPICQISLPRIRVIIKNVGTPVVYPPVAFVMAIPFTFAWFPCTTYPEWVTFLILNRFPHNTTYPANICRRRLADSPFLDFLFISGVLWVTSSVDVSKCDWGLAWDSWWIKIRLIPFRVITFFDSLLPSRSYFQINYTSCDAL